MTTLAIAAGGGGDALGILLAANLISGMTDPPLIATLAWERLRLDPTPGPRGRAGFVSLGVVSGTAVEVLPHSRPADADAWSSLPQLVESTGARVFLLDAISGAKGIAGQIGNLAQTLGVSHLAVIDVGGDAIARGDEAGLRSPLADALIIAGARGSGIPADLIVAGPGLDAELREQEVVDRLDSVKAHFLGDVPPPTPQLIKVLAWHPSEASALLATAALGVTGNVDMRRGDRLVPLSVNSPGAWRCELHRAAIANPYADAVASTSTLEESERACESVGPTELAYERMKARASPRFASVSSTTLVSRVVHYVHDARRRGADFATTRRIAEAIELPAFQTPQLTELLSLQPKARAGSIWDLEVVASGLARIVNESR